MLEGSVRYYKAEESCGVITSTEGEDYYFQLKDVCGDDIPKVGDIATFYGEEGHKGKFALDIAILTPERVEKPTNSIECHQCNRDIIPRVVVRNGSANHSVCPFCGTMIKDFGISALFFEQLADLIRGGFAVLRECFTTHPKSTLGGILVFALALWLNA